MQSLVFLTCFFFQKLSKKNLWRSALPPLGKGRVNRRPLGGGGGMIALQHNLVVIAPMVMKVWHRYGT